MDSQASAHVASVAKAPKVKAPQHHAPAPDVTVRDILLRTFEAFQRLLPERQQQSRPPSPDSRAQASHPYSPAYSAHVEHADFSAGAFVEEPHIAWEIQTYTHVNPPDAVAAQLQTPFAHELNILERFPPYLNAIQTSKMDRIHTIRDFLMEVMTKGGVPYEKIAPIENRYSLLQAYEKAHIFSMQRFMQMVSVALVYGTNHKHRVLELDSQLSLTHIPQYHARWLNTASTAQKPTKTSG